MEDYNESIDKVSEFWASVPGLRTKSFTSINGTNTGTGIYLFKTKESMDEYMKSELYLGMANYTQLTDQKV